MSSYTISKREYNKFAGVVDGAFYLNDNGHSCRENMNRIYLKNLESVNLQYEDNEQPDTDVYDREYEEGLDYGQAHGDSTGVKNGIFTFLRSIFYQIEDDDCLEEVIELLGDNLYAIANPPQRDKNYRNDWWGEVPITRQE